jgi:hypothetical protein
MAINSITGREREREKPAHNKDIKSAKLEQDFIHRDLEATK